MPKTGETTGLEGDERLRWRAARGTDSDRDVHLAGRGGNDGVRDEIRCGRRGRAVRGDHRQVAEVTPITVRVTVGLRVRVVLVESDANRREHHEQYCSRCRGPPQRNHGLIKGERPAGVKCVGRVCPRWGWTGN